MPEDHRAKQKSCFGDKKLVTTDMIVTSFAEEKRLNSLKQRKM